MSDSKVTRLLVAELWDIYSRTVVPRQALPDQRNELRKAFYAGAWAFYQTALNMMPALGDASEEQLRNYENAVKELKQFNDRMMGRMQ